MTKKTAREKLIAPDLPVVADLDPKKAARFKADTMLLPSPTMIRDAIAGIPLGETKTARQVGDELAREAGAGVTCPMLVGMFWRIVAEAADEDIADGFTNVAPWWRVTKNDRKPNPKLPGGEDRHRALLLREGVKI